MAKIIIPTPLRKFTDNQSTFETNGSTVKEAILELTNQHANLSKHLLDGDNNIRSFIRIFIGDEDMNSLDKEATLVSDDAVISIVPAIAGGVQ
ncbi:MAG: MoaD/ThiS family protein [Bacteroidota bacterium]